jgi:NAD(P)-dependent dehydrogenase (short-subunit alcohol dehydrogenase family)
MKTILITGSTDGIGKLAAIKLAKDGHQLLVHGRNVNKLENTIAEIKEHSKNEKVSGFVADFSDFESIHSLVSKITEEVSTIDVLVNNAGVFKSNAVSNKAGFDLRFMVNYLAPYTLTMGLLPLLEKSEAPRLINLSSAAQATVSLSALLGKDTLSNQETYAQSKLALTMWSFAFAKKFPKIITIAVNPGSLLNTKMVQEAYGKFWSSADKGADILYELAVLEKHESSNGKYFDNDIGSFNEAHQDAYNEEKVMQLISETEKIINS